MNQVLTVRGPQSAIDIALEVTEGCPEVKTVMLEPSLDHVTEANDYDGPVIELMLDDNPYRWNIIDLDDSSVLLSKICEDAVTIDRLEERAEAAEHELAVILKSLRVS